MSWLKDDYLIQAVWNGQKTSSGFQWNLFLSDDVFVDKERKKKCFLKRFISIFRSVRLLSNSIKVFIYTVLVIKEMPT